MSNVENWSPVRGFVGLYEASDHGRIRNIAHRPGTKPGLVLKPRPTTDGYLKVMLRNEGMDRYAFIHRLVFESHRRQLEDGEEVDHLDGNPSNNNLSNLEAVSRTENMRRSFVRGRKAARGEDQGRARFTDAEVVSIRRRVASGELQNALAAEFGVTPTAINCIVLRKTWRHLP